MVTSVDPANPNKPTMAKIEIDTGYCISCGICVEACPYNALHMGYAYERAKYRRLELVQANEGLLVSETRPLSAYLHADVEASLPEQTLLVEKFVKIRKNHGTDDRLLDTCSPDCAGSPQRNFAEKHL
jgi:formate hydrogenlyase subunit 6/NADH:ubiquinone oxidoreductase subunit I